MSKEGCFHVEVRCVFCICATTTLTFTPLPLTLSFLATSLSCSLRLSKGSYRVHVTVPALVATSWEASNLRGGVEMGEKELKWVRGCID